MKKKRSARLRCLTVCLCLVVIILVKVTTAGAERTQAPAETRRIDRWLDYDFDSSAPLGSAKNPAVILPATTAALLGDLPAARRAGDMLLIPVAEFQKAANQPFAKALLAPVLSQLTNVKSFDGFSAIDTTGLIKGLPSELRDPDALARRVSGENLESYGRLLRKGDLVFGSHVFNWMTWGKYIHVAIKKGRPYRWPILMGLDNNDESRFYCSQLVWRAYKQVMNIDLDSDKGALVFPDDLYYSKDYVDIIVP